MTWYEWGVSAGELCTYFFLPSDRASKAAFPYHISSLCPKLKWTAAGSVINACHKEWFLILILIGSSVTMQKLEHRSSCWLKQSYSNLKELKAVVHFPAVLYLLQFHWDYAVPAKQNFLFTPVKTEHCIWTSPSLPLSLALPFPSMTYLNLGFTFFNVCSGESNNMGFCALRFGPLASALQIQEDNYWSCNAHSPEWIWVYGGLLVSVEKWDAKRQVWERQR